MSAYVRIFPYGYLGNRMFQYMMAVALRRLSGKNLPIVGLNVPEWNIVSDRDQNGGSFVVKIRNHVVPQKALGSLISTCEHIEVQIMALSARVAFYEDHLSYFRELFANKTVTDVNDRSLVINVRAGDIASGSLHPNYHPLPIHWYEQLIDESGLEPVFMGQTEENNDYAIELRKKFKSATFMESRGALGDFNLIRQSRNVVLSVSTFSWLAAWLSNADNLYVPVTGIFDPISRPDMDLLPVNDGRYRFYELGLGGWENEVAMLSDLVSNTSSYPKITSGEVKSKYGDSLGTEGTTLTHDRGALA